MKLSTDKVREFFWKQPTESLCIPTATRNAIIAEEGYSTRPKMVSQGRVYQIMFKNMGGGMWYTYLAPLGAKL